MSLERDNLSLESLSRSTLLFEHDLCENPSPPATKYEEGQAFSDHASMPMEVKMSDWVKCTRHDGVAIYIHLGNAMSLAWNDKDGGTDVVFPGGQEDVILVKERPEEILKSAGK
jgi:hypothetical protein